MHFFGAQLRDDPYRTYAALRAEPHVHRSPVGMWVVGRHDDARGVLVSPAASNRTWMLDPTDLGPDPAGGAAPRRSLFEPPRGDQARGRVAELMQAWLPFIDPPHQSMLRRALAGPLREQLIERLRPSIPDIAAQTVAALPAGDPVDLVDGFARAIPLQVMGSLLGVGLRDAEWVADRVTEVTRCLSPFLNRQALVSVEASIRELQGFLERLIAARRARPGADLVTALVNAQAAVGFSEEDLVGLVMFVTVASQETSAAGLAAATQLLAAHPDQLLRAREQDAWRQAADEALRLESPVQMMLRRMTDVVHVAGTPLASGDHVLVVVGAANRDGEAFEHPEQFRVDRVENPHLAFGAGPHTCPGAPIAQATLAAALRALFARFRTIELDGSPRWEASLTLRSMRSLPARLSA